MRFLCGTLLILCLSPLLRAGNEIKWGEPVNGLRLGIVNPPTSATSDQDLTFKVIAENVSKQPITLPTPDTFMLKSNPQSNDYHESPLIPVIDMNRTGPSDVMGPETNISVTGLPSDLAPKTVITLAPGKSVTWNPVFMEKYFYFGDRLPPGDKTTIEVWPLLPNFMYHIRFRFENQAKQLDGQNLWTGRADSGVADVPLRAPNADEFKLQGSFTLEKTNYFIGEPVEATFTITNNGTEVIGFPTGGQYSASGRDGRFSFSASDEQGHAVPDPIRLDLQSGGGIGTDTQLNPGASYTDKLLINKWCAFTKPGKYTITCKRTLNLIRSKRSGPHFYPHPEDSLPTVPIETTLTITLVDDPAAEAALITHQVDLLLENPGDNGIYRGLASEHLASLAQAKTPAAFLEILRLLGGSAEVQLQAVEWLSSYGYEKASPVLLEHAPKLSPRARALALRTLSDWNTPGVELLVAAALRDPDLELRANTVLICSTHWYATCVPILLTMETDIDPVVRRNLGAALGASSDPRAIPVLIQLLHDYDPDPHIKTGAAAGLGKFKRYEGVPVMIDLLNDPKAEDAEGNVMSTLGILTGQNFGENRDAWLDWWEKTGKMQYGKGT